MMDESQFWIVFCGLILVSVATSLLLLRTIQNSSRTLEREIRDQLRSGRNESKEDSKSLREELQGSLETVRKTLDSRVKELQEGNEKKLDEMRKIVEEKLQETLEKRIGESFAQVSKRLESVQKGLGEMRNLASGVGDLKRVLTNVKTRGTWAEVQLGSILEQILSPTQFDKNVRIKDDSTQIVEYAVRLPGNPADPDSKVWLPIDSKFPQEDYIRLQDAAERGDKDEVRKASDALFRAVRLSAKEIHDKYISPPSTTDFGIMFLATEGLYAEVLRSPSLVEELQRKFRVVVTGPTTLAATLSSLRMGFQTLAIEQRAVEVWRVLAAVKTEFRKFDEILVKVKRQLNAASSTIDDTGVRTRAMARNLRSVEELSNDEAEEVLELEANESEVSEKNVSDDF